MFVQLTTTVGAAWRGFRASSLLVNAIYLMLGTAAVAVLGFIFWIIVARSYSTTTVGLAATILSLSGLLSLLSLAGFDTTLVRYLPKALRPTDYMNSGLWFVAAAALVLSTGCVLSFPVTAPGLAFILHNPWYFAAFVGFTVATALNTLTNAIFLAFKRARDIFIINVLLSVIKVALPLLVAGGSAMTIFVLVGVSQLGGLLLSLLVMYARVGYVFSLRIKGDVFRLSKRYGSSVYLSSILNLLPPTLLPLLVVHQLGAAQAAYYYIAFTIAGALYTISYACTQSAFAEGSHDVAAMRLHTTKAAKLIAALLTPAVLLTLFFGNTILAVFGNGYGTNAAQLLQVLALSALPVAIYSGLGVVFKVTKNLRGILWMNIGYALVILGLSYVLVPRQGVVAVGWAWAAGNVVAVSIGLCFLKQDKERVNNNGTITNTWWRRRRVVGNSK